MHNVRLKLDDDDDEEEEEGDEGDGGTEPADGAIFDELTMFESDQLTFQRYAKWKVNPVVHAKRGLLGLAKVRARIFSLSPGSSIVNFSFLNLLA